MNLILLFAEDFTGSSGRVRLKGRRHEHVYKILRASVNDELSVGLCGGKIGSGRVIELNENILEMDVRFDRNVPPKLPVTLILALPRPPMLKRILSTVSAMGVKSIILLQTSRVEKSFWKSPVLEEERMNQQLILGLEQAGDTIFPKVTLRRQFKPFVEDELPSIAERTLNLVAHPKAMDPCPRALKRPVTLVIGPEGGLVPYEIEKLTALGFIPVHLGERVLRVESAIPAILSRLF